MELSWPMKLRIAAAAALGLGLIGFLAWPLVAPADPFGIVSLVAGTITTQATAILLALAFAIGLVAYFICWPYGDRIAILAVPLGLAVWASRGGNMGNLMQLDVSIVRREQVFGVLCFEPLIWMAMVAAGFAGAFVASTIIHPPKPAQSPPPAKRTPGFYINLPVALIGSALLAHLFIGMFARDFSISEPGGGTAISQPSTAQIAFAVLVAFGLAGFLVKKILNLDYCLPILSSCLVTPLAIASYAKPAVLDYFAGRWPAVFYANSVVAVLPIQMVAFGTLGAIIGYWIAVRYDYWRQHETGHG